MVMSGCMVFQAQGGADVDITMTAVNSAQEYSIMLIEKDTNLLILLYYAGANANPLYFRSDNHSRGSESILHH